MQQSKALLEIIKKMGCENVEEMKTNLNNIETQLNNWKFVKLNIAFIGETKAGKSTLINALRGLYAQDKGACQVDPLQCTMFSKPYKHPSNENIIFWDIPGVNTREFGIDNYLEEISFIKKEHCSEIEDFDKISQPIKYDCFVICYKDTVHETDMKIYFELKKRSINCYLVRTQIDLALEQKSNNLGKDLDDNEIENFFCNITNDAEKYFKLKNLRHDKLFLLSALMVKHKKIDMRNKFDFEKFQLKLINDLEKNKGDTLILSIFPFAGEIIKAKFKLLKERILKRSCISGIAGLIPVPGVSMIVDLQILNDEVCFYITTLGINKKTMKYYADLFGIQYEMLHNDVLKKNVFFDGILNIGNASSIFTGEYYKILSDLLLAFLSTTLASNAAEEAIKGYLLLVPVIGQVIGSMVGSAISFGTTYYSLQKVLDNFETTLLETLEYCNKKQTNL